MSANNWTTCPKCKEITEKKQTEAGEAYGNVSEKEYLAILTKYTETNEDRTLREDYEIGVTEEGDFYAIYRCSCNVCDFSYYYKYEKNILDST